jgi:hypothetical protein
MTSSRRRRSQKVVDEKSVQEANPAYVLWVTRDQAVLGFLLSSLTRETLMHVSRCTSLAQAWSGLGELYSSQSRAPSMNTRIALVTTKKNQLSVSDYYAKMSSYAVELAASRTPLDEFIAYLLACLDKNLTLCSPLWWPRSIPSSQVIPFPSFSVLRTTLIYMRLLLSVARPLLYLPRVDEAFLVDVDLVPQTEALSVVVAAAADVLPVVVFPTGATVVALENHQDFSANCAKRLATLPRPAGTIMMMMALNSALPPWFPMMVTMRGTQTLVPRM